jgi:hypothetical protein
MQKMLEIFDQEYDDAVRGKLLNAQIPAAVNSTNQIESRETRMFWSKKDSSVFGDKAIMWKPIEMESGLMDQMESGLMDQIPSGLMNPMESCLMDLLIDINQPTEVNLEFRPMARIAKDPDCARRVQRSLESVSDMTEKGRCPLDSIRLVVILVSTEMTWTIGFKSTPKLIKYDLEVPWYYLNLFSRMIRSFAEYQETGELPRLAMRPIR